MNITSQKTYALVALGAIFMNFSGIAAMQETPSTQLWYQAKIHNKVQQLNYSFAQLIGATQDFASRETLKQYVEQTRKDLDTVHDMVKQFNWCPGLIDQAVAQIKDKLVVSFDTAWTGSYVKTDLGKQFTLAQDMKNWLLLACSQTDNKKESAEYAKLQLMWLEKDFLEIRHAFKEEECQFKESSEYLDLKYKIINKKNSQELSWWNNLCYETNLIWAGFNGVMFGKEQEEHYKNLFDQEVETLEDTLNQHDTRLNKASLNYSANLNNIKNKKITSLQGACLQTNTDELIFRNKQGELNSFYDLVWKLFNVKSRQNILIGENLCDDYNPIKYYFSVKANQWYNIFGAETIQDMTEKSKGQKVVDVVKAVDVILYYRDLVGEIPSAVAVKCLSMLLASPALRDTVIAMGVPQNIMDKLVGIKLSCNENGFSINDVLQASSIIGDKDLGLVVKLVIKAIGKAPEKWVNSIDVALSSAREWIDSKGELDFSSAKTAIDDHELLSYIAMANKNTYVSPIHVIEKPEQSVVSLSESIYHNVVNKKTFAVLGLAGVVYGSYRSGLPQWALHKAKDVSGNVSLASLGVFAYTYASGYWKK